MNLPGFNPTAPSLLPSSVLTQIAHVAQIAPLAQAQSAQPAQNADTAAPPAAQDQSNQTAVESVDGSPDAAAPAKPANPQWFDVLRSPFVPLIVLMVIFFIFMGSGNRKKEKERKAMINSLTRGDRVTTIGGIIGNVVDANGDEITLKIDETSNTKMKITRSAVASVSKPGEDKK